MWNNIWAVAAVTLMANYNFSYSTIFIPCDTIYTQARNYILKENDAYFIPGSSKLNFIFCKNLKYHQRCDLQAQTVVHFSVQNQSQLFAEIIWETLTGGGKKEIWPRVSFDRSIQGEGGRAVRLGRMMHGWQTLDLVVVVVVVGRSDGLPDHSRARQRFEAETCDRQEEIVWGNVPNNVSVNDKSGNLWLWVVGWLAGWLRPACLSVCLLACPSRVSGKMLVSVVGGAFKLLLCRGRFVTLPVRGLFFHPCFTWSVLSLGLYGLFWHPHYTRAVLSLTFCSRVILWLFFHPSCTRVIVSSFRTRVIVQHKGIGEGSCLRLCLFAL